MKRFSSQLCNLELRMRKKAALDLQAIINHKKEIERTESANKMNQASGLISLGGDYFVAVCSFNGFTRVHIRKYVSDDEGRLKPTTDGITFSPTVWNLLQKENFFQQRNGVMDKVTIINRMLCVSIQPVNNEKTYVFQRLFQRKNLSLEFLPKLVVLNNDQFSILKSAVSMITEQLKETLITETLQWYVVEELKQVDDLGYSTTFHDMTDLLMGCITNAIDKKIAELSTKPETRLMENTLSRTEKFQKYFESCLYELDWSHVAKDFVDKSKYLDIKTLIVQEEYFDSLNVNAMFENIEKFYIGESNEDSIIC